MTRPAIEVADVVRAKGRQFLERFRAILSYQQLKAFRAVLRCRTAALGGHRQVCRLPVRSTHFLQLLQVTQLPQVPGAGPPAMARGTATRPAQHELFPRRLHRAPRTEPAGAHYSQAIFRSAVPGQLPDSARGGRRSEAARCRGRISLHPAHLEPEPAGPSPCSLRRSCRWIVGRSPAMDPH